MSPKPLGSWGDFIECLRLFLWRGQIAAVDPVAAIALVLGLKESMPVALGGEQPGLVIECFLNRALLFSVGEKGFEIRLL